MSDRRSAPDLDEEQEVDLASAWERVKLRWWLPVGGLVVYTSTQVPHELRGHLAGSLGLDERGLRVVARDVGGAFGSKLNPYPEDLLCAALARFSFDWRRVTG